VQGLLFVLGTTAPGRFGLIVTCAKTKAGIVTIKIIKKTINAFLKKFDLI
jgi:hypothetical protein